MNSTKHLKQWLDEVSAAIASAAPISASLILGTPFVRDDGRAHEKSLAALGFREVGDFWERNDERYPDDGLTTSAGGASLDNLERERLTLLADAERVGVPIYLPESATLLPVGLYGDDHPIRHMLAAAPALAVMVGPLDDPQGELAFLLATQSAGWGLCMRIALEAHASTPVSARAQTNLEMMRARLAKETDPGRRTDLVEQLSARFGDLSPGIVNLRVDAEYERALGPYLRRAFLHEGSTPPKGGPPPASPGDSAGPHSPLTKNIQQWLEEIETAIDSGHPVQSSLVLGTPFTDEMMRPCKRSLIALGFTEAPTHWVRAGESYASTPDGVEGDAWSLFELEVFRKELLEKAVHRSAVVYAPKSLEVLETGLDLREHPIKHMLEAAPNLCLAFHPTTDHNAEIGVLVMHRAVTWAQALRLALESQAVNPPDGDPLEIMAQAKGTIIATASDTDRAALLEQLSMRYGTLHKKSDEIQDDDHFAASLAPYLKKVFLGQ